jgi:uncharacterized membrane protein YsdA (DUF1294 family)
MKLVLKMLFWSDRNFAATHNTRINDEVLCVVVFNLL